MHIASALTLVRREPAQTDAPGHVRGAGRLRFPGIRAQVARVQAGARAEATRTRLRAVLPGAILLTVLALAGTLFPILF